MRGRAVLAVVATALSLVGGTTSAGGAERPVNPRTGVALSPCFSDDHGTPVVRAIRLSRDTVDVTAHRRTVDVVVDAVDTGGPGPASGLESVVLSLYAGLPDVTFPALTPASDGTWRTTVTVPKRTSPGNWLFWAVATDRVGFATPGPGPYGYLPEPQAHLEVISATDERDPVVGHVRLSRRTVDALSHRRTVEVSVVAKDTESGVSSVLARLGRVDDRQSTPEVRLHRVSGDAHRGRWVGRVTVPRWAFPGRWSPGLLVYDRFGHQGVLNWTFGDGGGLPRVRVRSAPDSAAPVPVSMSVTPATVDVRAGTRTVVVDVRATDAQSGVATVRLEVSGRELLRPSARLVSGTRHDGTWRTTLTVNPCDEAKDWQIRVDTVTDRRGRQFYGYGQPHGPARTVTVVNTDRVGPGVARHTVDAGTVRLDLTEDVVGISDTSVAVYYVQYPRPYEPQPRVSGTWQCADSAGVPSDCLRGPVRTATFVAAQPLAAGYYTPVLNPEHVLDVTDLAGNPAGDARRTG